MGGESLEDLLRMATVRVEGGPRPGAGFFVAPGQLLTCAHVVGSPGETSIRWRQAGHRPESVRVESVVRLCDQGRPISALDEDYPDLAILSVGVPDHACVALDEAWPVHSDRFQTYGYPDEGGAVLLTAAALTYRGTKAADPTVFIDLASDTVKPGMSGAALLNLRSKAVCGILVATRNPASPDGGLAVPLTALRGHLGEILEANRAYHRADRRWATAAAMTLAPPATTGEDLGDVACPYKGLRPFERDDARLFFGREAQVEQVLARLAEVRFVAVVGASGSGKSSFVRAGLLADIGAAAANGDRGARVVVLTPGEHPLDELATAVTAATGVDAQLRSDDLRADPNTLERAASRAGDGSLVIVVDQLEELFTLCREEAERGCFVDALIAAWRDASSPVVVILALRADFYGRVADYPELAAAVVAHQTLIGPMSPTDLKRVIELPAAATSLRLQPGLAQTMLEDLTDEPGALPLLSHALLETWKRRESLQLTVGGYRKAGGVRGAIAQTAERTLQALPQADRAIARSIFLSLTELAESAEPTRRRVDRADLAAHPQRAASLDRVLGILADARLVSIDERTVVVAHEALIRHWPRLRRWLEEDRDDLRVQRRLTEAAREWRALGRDPDALYRGARLAAACEWIAKREPELGELEREFVQTSQAAEQAEFASARRRARRQRRFAGVLAALVVVSIVAAFVAIDRSNETRRQELVSLSRSLATQARSVLDSDPALAAVLSIEADRMSSTFEARSAALAVIAGLKHRLGVTLRHYQPLYDVAIDRDGSLLAIGSRDGTVRLWDIARRRQLGTLVGHKGRVIAVALSPSGKLVASAGVDGVVRLWDVARRQLERSVATGSGVLRDVAFSPNGKLLASAGDGGVRVSDVASRQVRFVTRADDVNGIAFSPDGKRLATGHADGGVRLWDIARGGPAGRPLAGGRAAVFDVALSPDGTLLAAARSDGKVVLWNVARRRRVKVLAGPTSEVIAVAFSRDGSTLATANQDQTARLWDVRSGQALGAPLKGHTSGVSAATFSRDGTSLYTAGSDGSVREWDATRSRPLTTPLASDRSGIVTVAFSRDSKILATAGYMENVRLWDARRRAPSASFPGPPRDDIYLAFGPGDRVLATSGTDKRVRLYDVARHAPLASRVAKDHLHGVAISSDGLLAAGSDDNTVPLWNLTRNRPLGALKDHRADVYTVAFSPDGRTLASGGIDGNVILWDVADRRRRHPPLAGHSGIVLDVAFSPDGRTLASANSDRTVRLWDVRSGRQLGAPLTGHTNWVRAVAFSPDGKTLASVGRDKTMRLWDVARREAIGAPLTEQGDDVLDVAFSPDGTMLATASLKSVRFWDPILWRADRKALTRYLCTRVRRSLTRAQWQTFLPGEPYHETCRP